jgi:hypothetical protein
MLVSGLMASAALAIAIACGGGTPTVPSSGAVATFAIGSETFRMSLTTADQVAAVRAAQSGGGGRIFQAVALLPGMQDNSPWSWHLEEVTFVEAAIELCDGRPADVERAGIQFGGGRFCPWPAIVIPIDEN